MKHDDDDVGFDLTAWEVPPPQANLADAVIARVHAPAPAAAVEPTTARNPKWWIAGALAAVAIGVVSVALAMRGDDERNSSGAVATAKPSHLELGGTAVDLERDTDVWWVRDGKRIVAMQPRGAATWRVAPGDELVIDAGATVASVSASGASLRVEVEMNLSDARLIGTSAATAAAIALVTVIVYEGHVKVTGSDKTVEVAAGSTVQIAPNKAPVEPDRVADLEKRLRSEIEFLKLENDLLKKQMAGTIPRPADLKAFQAGMAALEPAIQRCGETFDVSGQFTLSVEIEAGMPRTEWDASTPAPARFGDCVERLYGRYRFPTTLTGSFEHRIDIEERTVAVAPRQQPSPPPPPTRDIDDEPVNTPSTVDSTPASCNDKLALAELESKGDAQMTNGSYASALAHFEKVLKCKPSVVPKAYLAACRSRNFPRAKVHFQAFKRQGRGDAYAQICLKEGFDPRK